MCFTAVSLTLCLKKFSYSLGKRKNRKSLKLLGRMYVILSSKSIMFLWCCCDGKFSEGEGYGFSCMELKILNQVLYLMRVSLPCCGS